MVALIATVGATFWATTDVIRIEIAKASAIARLERFIKHLQELCSCEFV
jgi:hypothetical protein